MCSTHLTTTLVFLVLSPNHMVDGLTLMMCSRLPFWEVIPQGSLFARKNSSSCGTNSVNGNIQAGTTEAGASQHPAGHFGQHTAVSLNRRNHQLLRLLPFSFLKMNLLKSYYWPLRARRLPQFPWKILRLFHPCFCSRRYYWGLGDSEGLESTRTCKNPKCSLLQTEHLQWPLDGSHRRRRSLLKQDQQHSQQRNGLRGWLAAWTYNSRRCNVLWRESSGALTAIKDSPQNQPWLTVVLRITRSLIKPHTHTQRVIMALWKCSHGGQAS